eukprot:scaffold421695_cov71-Attheya_sp.AAC.2
MKLLRKPKKERSCIAGSPFYAAAQSVGDLVFVAGQIGLVNKPDGTKELTEGGIQGQTRQALENLTQVLTASGSSRDHVLKTTCLLHSIDDYDAFNEVYLQFFDKPIKPARVCFGPGGLPMGALVEIDATAIRA